MADPYKSVGGYWFMCEKGHRIRHASAPDLPSCPALVHSDGRAAAHIVGSSCTDDQPCGADIEYRLVDYWTLGSWEMSHSGSRVEDP